MVTKPPPAVSTSGAGLEIRLLGELTVLRQGQIVPLPASKKTRALLAYLVATGRPHLRENLCELLWDGPDDPRAALRWSLAKLRPVIDEGPTLRLIADRERVGVELRGVTVDLIQIRAWVGWAGATMAPTSSLVEAAAWLRGELLEGLDLPDCYRFSEWRRAEREAARGLARALHVRLIECHEQEPETALGHARALVAADPLDEAAHATVMRFLGALGRHKDALLQYETCRRILAAESGTRPSLVLDRARALLGVRPDAVSASELPDARVAPVVPEVMPRGASSAPETPLVGREPECATLTEFVRSPEGGFDALLVLGEPGVGKTRLLDELARIVRHLGGRVLRGRAFEAEMIRPYGAWIDALRDLGPPDPFVVAKGETASGTGDRSLLFGAVVARLRTQAKEGPVVVILDDIHWIDEASAALIHYAVRQLKNTRVRVACGARPAELADNVVARRLVRALTREASVRQIGLSPLDRSSTATLSRAYGDGIDVDRVFMESGGNPLFAIEVARALARGVLVSGSLDALLCERLDQLEGATREAVAWAATIGGAFSTELLLRVTGLDAASGVRTAEELERRGFFRPAVVTGGALGYDFAHDLMRRAAYHAISEPRRRMMHVAIARSLDASTDAEGTLAGDIAHHAALGDDSDLAARASLAAAERCVRLFANDEAIAQIERGLRSSARLPTLAKARLDVELLRVSIYADTGRRRTGALEAAMRHAIFEAEALGCTAEVARGLMALSYLHFDTGDFAGATSDSLRAEPHARATEPVQAVHALAHLAQCLALLERELPRAQALTAEAARLAADLGTDVPELWVARALIEYHRGDIDGAIVLFGRALAFADRRQQHWLAAICLTRLAMSELHARRPEAALEHCRRLRDVATRMAESSEGPFGAALEAVARRELGDPGADTDEDEALRSLHARDAQTYLAEALCLAAEGDLRRGDSEKAQNRASRALAAASTSARPSSIVWARVLLARAALAFGREEAARAEIALAVALLEHEGDGPTLARKKLTTMEQDLAALASARIGRI